MLQGRPSKSGTSLVEVIIAILILAILVLAATQSIRYSKTMATQQRNRRVALEIANGRLEDMRAAGYSQIAHATKNSSVRYLSRSTNSWSISSSNPNETTVVNGRTRPMVTTVQYIDADGGSTSYDCLRVAVRVYYGPGTNEFVGLETIRSPL